MEEGEGLVPGATLGPQVPQALRVRRHDTVVRVLDPAYERTSLSVFSTGPESTDWDKHVTWHLAILFFRVVSGWRDLIFAQVMKLTCFSVGYPASHNGEGAIIIGEGTIMVRSELKKASRRCWLEFISSRCNLFSPAIIMA